MLVLLLLLPVGAAALLLGVLSASEPSSESPSSPGRGAPEQEAPVPEGDAPGRDGAGPEDAPDGGTGTGPDEVPDPSAMPAPAELSGRDAAMAELLTSVAASEEPMRAWQQAQQEALLEAPPDADAQEILSRLQAAGEEAASALAEARGPLEGPVDEGGVDAVRAAYLEHHDAWADYLEAVADDPSAVAENAETQRWSQAINATAERFAEALEAELDDELHPQVRAYAEELLASGFELPETVPDV